MTEPLFSMALVTGLLGTGHCLGMCGGLVAALSLAGEGRPRGLAFHAWYNLGRLVTYTSIGLAVGWLGSAFAYTDAFSEVSRGVLVASDLFVILLGVGTAGTFRRFSVSRLEFAGLDGLTAAAARLRGMPGPAVGFPLGLLMGLLPCGFLYAVAITAAQSASPGRGAGILFSFGLGTLPGLFFFGGGTHWLGRRLRQGMVRAAGVVVALMGGVNLFRHGELLGWW